MPERPRLRQYQISDLKKIDDAFEQHARVCYQLQRAAAKR